MQNKLLLLCIEISQQLFYYKIYHQKAYHFFCIQMKEVFYSLVNAFGVLVWEKRKWVMSWYLRVTYFIVTTYNAALKVKYFWAIYHMSYPTNYMAPMNVIQCWFLQYFLASYFKQGCYWLGSTRSSSLNFLSFFLELNWPHFFSLICWYCGLAGIVLSIFIFG